MASTQTTIARICSTYCFICARFGQRSWIASRSFCDAPISLRLSFPVTRHFKPSFEILTLRSTAPSIAPKTTKTAATPARMSPTANTAPSAAPPVTTPAATPMPAITPEAAPTMPIRSNMTDCSFSLLSILRGHQTKYKWKDNERLEEKILKRGKGILFLQRVVLGQLFAIQDGADLGLEVGGRVEAAVAQDGVEFVADAVYGSIAVCWVSGFISK